MKQGVHQCSSTLDGGNKVCFRARVLQEDSWAFGLILVNFPFYSVLSCLVCGCEQVNVLRHLL